MLEPIPSGIFFGLAFGKPIGAILFPEIFILLGITKLPPNMNWTRLFDVALFCGIDFTMSIFWGSLAPQEADLGYTRTDRLVIILASLTASIAGYTVLRFSCQKLEIDKK